VKIKIPAKMVGERKGKEVDGEPKNVGLKLSKAEKNSKC
jgi:hypothetical protein